MLQHVAVNVIENHVCESWHRRKGIDIRIYDEMMCAGYEVGQRDACQVSVFASRRPPQRHLLARREKQMAGEQTILRPAITIMIMIMIINDHVHT